MADAAVNEARPVAPPRESTRMRAMRAQLEDAEKQSVWAGGRYRVALQTGEPDKERLADLAEAAAFAAQRVAGLARMVAREERETT